LSTAPPEEIKGWIYPMQMAKNKNKEMIMDYTRTRIFFHLGRAGKGGGGLQTPWSLPSQQTGLEMQH